MFGGLNTIFSGLALAGVVLAIFMQREELRLQRRELHLTREELQRQADAQTGSKRALEAQIEALLLAAQVQALGGILQTEIAAALNPQSIYVEKSGRVRPGEDLGGLLEELRGLSSHLNWRIRQKLGSDRNLDRNPGSGDSGPAS